MVKLLLRGRHLNHQRTTLFVLRPKHIHMRAFPTAFFAGKKHCGCSLTGHKSPINALFLHPLVSSKECNKVDKYTALSYKNALSLATEDVK